MKDTGCQRSEASWKTSLTMYVCAPRSEQNLSARATLTAGAVETRKKTVSKLGSPKSRPFPGIRYSSPAIIWNFLQAR